eukprot:SAG11_NODE_38530_length_252_cov_0.575163_1_plen_23_part_10
MNQQIVLIDSLLVTLAIGLLISA